MTERVCEECYETLGSSNEYVIHKAEAHKEEGEE
jgi:hypothetical protein